MTKAVKIIFTLSILLNIVLVGMAGGMAYKKMCERPWDDMKAPLAPETKALMDKTFEGRREKIHGMIKEMESRKRNLKDIIIAEQFDIEAYKAAVTNAETFSDEMLVGKTETFGGILSQLPKAEREKLADRFVEMLTGASRRDKKDGHKHHDRPSPPPHERGDAPPPPPPPPEGENPPPRME